VLLAAQDADETLAQAAFADLLLHQVFLAVAPLKIDVGSIVVGGELFGVRDETLRFALGEGQEVFASDAEGMIDEALKVGLVGDGEVALEADAILAAENGDAGRGELDEERVRRLHGCEPTTHRRAFSDSAL